MFFFKYKSHEIFKTVTLYYTKKILWLFCKNLVKFELNRNDTQCKLDILSLVDTAQ